MFPFFEPIPGLIIYTFGLTITICFFLFLWMLKKLSIKLVFDYSIFTKNLVWYCLSVFIFSRIFYVIGKWNELKYIDDPLGFFIMSDYNFSLIGAMFGFIIVLLINLRIKKEKIIEYIDGLSLSFLFISSIAYVGSLLGGQVYGRETNFGIEIMYSHPFSPVPFEVPVFPLPIIYAILFFILFSVSYITSMFIHIKGLIGYLSLIIFSSILLIFEFFSGKHSTFKDFIGVNLTQICALIFIGICVKKVYEILELDGNKKTIIS